MGGAGVDRSRILGRRGPLSPAARAGPERLGALDPSRESPHGCLGECRAANESRSPALEDEKMALEKTVSGILLPLCYGGLNGCWGFFCVPSGSQLYQFVEILISSGIPFVYQNEPETCLSFFTVPQDWSSPDGYQ